MDAIDHRHHRVQPGNVREAFAGLVAEFEGGGHRQGFGNAGAFDQQVVEAAFLRQAPNLLKQVVAQRAANAAIGHLDQLFLGAA